jgi:RNA-directed DNA polymerase
VAGPPDRSEPHEKLSCRGRQVHMATRSREGYGGMSANSIVQRALNNRWLHEQGLPDMRRLWIALHYGPQARV